MVIDIQQPVSPWPWSQQPGKPPYYDRDLKVVSFIENAPFLFYVAQCHFPLIAALVTARSSILLGQRRPQKVLDEINKTLALVGIEPGVKP